MGRSSFDPQKAFSSLGLAPFDRLLVAYSGGGDSTFLLSEALDYFRSIEVAYVNYHDTPSSDEEERIVLSFLEGRGVPLHQKDVFLPSDRPNFEAEARRIRYEFFREVVARKELKGVLVGHQANDDAETYLLQRKRGILSREVGLSKISEIFQIVVYRPLLSLSKREILASLKKRGIPFYDDPTNKNPKRERDALRMGFLSSPKKLEEVLEERGEERKRRAGEISSAQAFLKQEEYGFKAYRSLDSNAQKRFLFEAMRILFPRGEEPFLVSRWHLSFEFLKSDKTGVLSLSTSVFLYKNAKDFFFGKRLKRGRKKVLVKKPGIYSFPPFRLNLTSLNLPYPLSIAAVKKGDRLTGGLKGKDAAKFLKRHGVPAYLRSCYPAVYRSRGAIVWIPFPSDARLTLDAAVLLPKARR